MSTEPESKLEVVEPSALEAIERASIDMQIATAKRYPRSIGEVKKEMLSFATLDEETAESCFYSLPRGGKNIQGPSVRLAEIAISCYGNLRVATRVISTVTGGGTPHVIVQAVGHDLQRNVAISIEKRRRITKKKSKEFVDEDDINLATNACAAIAIRDAVFKIVPLALIKPVYEEAKRVAIGDSKTFASRRDRAIERFAKMGVSVERILGLLDKKALDDISLGDLETLFGLLTAIKDGQTSIDDAFPATKPVASKPVFSKPEPSPAAPEQSEAPAESAESAPENPPRRATPLEGLRNLLETSKVKEETLMKYLVSNRFIEPSDKLEKLSDAKVRKIIESYASFADELDKEF